MARLINSLELREVILAVLGTSGSTSRGGRGSHGVGLHQLQGMCPKMVVLFVDNDTELRSG